MNADQVYLRQRVETFGHHGFAAAPDATASRRRPGASFVHALLATALFRCWHILVLYAGWATLITVLDYHHYKVRIPNTLLTVVGTVLGFIISYRTTSSFERYNEGRRLWSQIILASRTFARTTWYQEPSGGQTADEMKARGMVEKKTIINLIEAFAVAVKHYLRAEDGIYYQDLYYLVKFLPAYALPPGIASNADLINPSDDFFPRPPNLSAPPQVPQSSPGTSFLYQRTSPTVPNQPTYSQSDPGLPLPVTSPERRTSFRGRLTIQEHGPTRPTPPPLVLSPPTRDNSLEEKESQKGADLARATSTTSVRTLRSPLPGEPQKVILPRSDEAFLLPGKLPPGYHIFDLWPLSMLVSCLTARGRSVKGKKAARIRAKMLRENAKGSHNLPLEISLYLSSYIAALQRRKQLDVPTTNMLLGTLNQLVDALTGLERILTTPVPHSYSIHLWVVACLYCLALPSQIIATMGWLTIPGTIIVAFIFIGFLSAGEEIENPFGYDKNDLNLDHFTSNIIRSELRAITSSSAPDPARWAFAAENDLLFANDPNVDERVGPDVWIKRGSGAMLGALSVV
ncbi:hypothetical protein MKEN_00355500 [Mycena kentingensis (nom. inval.)]|nr:hypothetical protein MKEN_00355500 [Mycena kentingensis (nom. inval.)]